MGPLTSRLSQIMASRARSSTACCPTRFGYQFASVLCSRIGLITADQEQPRQTKSTLDEVQEKVFEGEDCIVEAEPNKDVNNVVNKQTLNIISQCTASKRIKISPKRNRGEEELRKRKPILEKASAVLIKPDDEYYGLGKTCAAKLRCIPASQRDIANKLLQLALKDSSSQLNGTSKIREVYGELTPNLARESGSASQTCESDSLVYGALKILEMNVPSIIHTLNLVGKNTSESCNRSLFLDWVQHV
ncbi:hypothetical protein J6590_092036 [Homalodisca vitripennis]|nr:hypothetical protein J6590_092036 [Homalodisca vitripennis]